MSVKRLLSEFVITGLITFVVAAAVSYVYSLLAHRAGTVDWETAIRMAIILGIVLTWGSHRKPRS